MFQKFIINRDGVLKFGRVYLHRDMLSPGEQCTYGGGLWKIDEGRGCHRALRQKFRLRPSRFRLCETDRLDGLGRRPRPLFYLPHWPSEEEIVPVIIN